MCSMLNGIQHVQVFLKYLTHYKQALLDTGKIPAGTLIPVLISLLGAEPATRCGHQVAFELYRKPKLFSYVPL